MIKVILTKKDDNVNKVIINGHAGYDDFGKDIVCAAVSSTVITTINILLSLDNQKDLIKFIENINTTAPILISKSLDNLEEDIKLSKYFKEGTAIKKIKAMIYKKEIVQ